MPAGSKQPIVVHYTEHCPPDVGAAFIWLKNRDPERWRDVQNVEHVMGKYLISDKPMTLEEWASARATVVNEVIDDSVTPALPLGYRATQERPVNKGLLRSKHVISYYMSTNVSKPNSPSPDGKRSPAKRYSMPWNGCFATRPSRSSATRSARPGENEEGH
jgi:hypothetical protein